MTRRPGERDPEPPGGRAAERLREFIEQRFPGRKGPPEPDLEPEPEREPESDAERHENRQTSEEPGEVDVAREEGEEEEHESRPGPEGSGS